MRFTVALLIALAASVSAYWYPPYTPEILHDIVRSSRNIRHKKPTTNEFYHYAVQILRKNVGPARFNVIVVPMGTAITFGPEAGVSSRPQPAQYLP